MKFADTDLRCTSLLRWRRRAREFQKHCHQLKITIKKRLKQVFAFIFTGEMEKLYRQITETQGINQKLKLEGTVTADLRINTFKKHECFAASTSCFVYLFTVRLASETGSAQGPTSGRAGSKAALPLPAPAKFNQISWDSCTIKTSLLRVLTGTLTDNLKNGGERTALGCSHNFCTALQSDGRPDSCVS